MNLGAVVGTGAGIQPPTGPLAPDEKTFWSEVDKFKAKAGEAYDLWQVLRTKRQASLADPRLTAEYDDVMTKAEQLTTKASDVERIAAQVKSTTGNTIKSWFGLEGYNHAAQKLGSLGFVQVFAIAAIGAAIAYVSGWLGEAYIVDRKLTAVESLVDKGVDPRTAGGLVVDKGDPGPFAGMFDNIGTGVAVAGIAAVVLYFFFQKKRGF